MEFIFCISLNLLSSLVLDSFLYMRFTCIYYLVSILLKSFIALLTVQGATPLSTSLLATSLSQSLGPSQMRHDPHPTVSFRPYLSRILVYSA